MTYCLALRLDDGLVFGADTRTNAGVDYVTSYRKLHVFAAAEDRLFVLLSAGNLGVTQELCHWLTRDLEADDGRENLTTATQMFEAADYVGRVSRAVQDRHGPAFAASGVSGVAGGVPRRIGARRSETRRAGRRRVPRPRVAWRSRSSSTRRRSVHDASPSRPRRCAG